MLSKFRVGIVATMVAALMVSICSASATAATLPAPAVSTAGVVPPGLASLAPYAQATASGYMLTAPKSVLASIDPSLLSALKSYHAQVHKAVANGSLVFANGTYEPKTTSVTTSSTSALALTTTATTRPSVHAFIIYYWWGMQVGVDTWLRDKIAGGLLFGSALAAYFGGPYGAAIALAMTLQIAVLYICEHTNGWSYIYWIGTFPPYGTEFCNPF